VDLSWPLPADGGDGCHLYRTVDGRARRLNAVLLRPAATGYRYQDDTTTLPAGANVAYSYAIVRGGTEIARSPAVEVRLPGADLLVTQLLPNRPNPFNPETEIPFALGRSGNVRISVYDVSGRRIATLLDEARSAGSGRVVWRGRDDRGRVVPSGPYYVTLETDFTRRTRKVMLLK